MDLTELYCFVDDFCIVWKKVMQQQKNLLEAPKTKRSRKTQQRRTRTPRLSLAEMMTLLLDFQSSGYKTLKDYYIKHAMMHLRSEFPGLLSYNRFVEKIPVTLLPLCLLLKSRMGVCSGLSFIDSFPLEVCRTQRAHCHKVFEHQATWGKTSMGWFFGFKLHVVVNEQGELLSFCLTQGNVDDRKPAYSLTAKLFGKLFGDKGYISQTLFEELFARGLQLITRLKKNMKQRLLPLFDKLMLRKRALIESVGDQLKNVCMVEHTRHRSPYNFLVNLLCALLSYTLLPKKPHIHLDYAPSSGLPVIL